MHSTRDDVLGQAQIQFRSGRQQHLVMGMTESVLEFRRNKRITNSSGESSKRSRSCRINEKVGHRESSSPAGICRIIQKICQGHQSRFKHCHYKNEYCSHLQMAPHASTSTSSSSASLGSTRPLRRLSLTSVAPPRSIPGPPIRFFWATKPSSVFQASCSGAFLVGRPRPREPSSCCNTLDTIASNRSGSITIRGVICRPWLSLRYMSESTASG